jgi:hypothetical protein
MEHQPFETWLLEDEHLTPEQQRDLRRHAAACSQCAMLASANLALRAAPVARPASGFTLRFERRLAAERKIQKRRAMIGAVLLTVASLGIIYWLITPFLPYLSLSPTQMFITWVSAMLYLASLGQALGTIGVVLSRVVLALVPISAWLVLLGAGGGAAALWLASFRKTGNKTKAYSRVRL